jgi:hypothetical protein
MFVGSTPATDANSGAWLFSSNGGGPGVGGGSWATQSASNLVYNVYTATGASSFIFAENLSINTTEEETTNTTSLGQTFLAAGTGFLVDAKFQLSIPTASPPNSGNLAVKLYQDNGSGQPGTLIETSSAINSASLTTSPTIYTFAFSGLNTLTSGTLYHAILDTSGLTGTGSPATISWTPQPVFASPYLPATGDLLVVTQGLQFANQIAEFNGTTWLVNYIVRHFNGVDFWEESAIIASTAPNNATTTIFSVTALGSENIVIEGSILRNGNKETFTLWLTNNGTDAEVSGGGSYTATTGVTFSAAIVSGNVQLIATCDNSGGDATVKYLTRRWSDGGAGPTGLPSYSPSFISTQSAFTMSDGSATPYNCTSPVNVGGSTQITLDFTYLVGLNSGSTVGALGVFVNGQRISRVTPGVTGNPGTYYTEVSNTTIGFVNYLGAGVNIMSTPLSVEIIVES